MSLNGERSRAFLFHLCRESLHVSPTTTALVDRLTCHLGLPVFQVRQTNNDFTRNVNSVSPLTAQECELSRLMNLETCWCPHKGSAHMPDMGIVSLLRRLRFQFKDLRGAAAWNGTCNISPRRATT
jgi:hypothetical protein